MVGTSVKGKSKIKRKGGPGRLKSRSFRRVFVKIPGGSTVVHFKKRKPAKHKCAKCGAVLGGTLRERPYKMQNLAKTKKKPNRAYGGYLCAKCLILQLKAEVRK